MKLQLHRLPSSPTASEGEKECEEKFFFFRLVFDSTNEVLFAYRAFRMSLKTSDTDFSPSTSFILNPSFLK